MKVKSMYAALMLNIVSLIFLSCSAENQYKNRKYNYRVTYPEGFLALKSTIDVAGQETFLESIKKEKTFISTENVDVVFCDPVGPAPHYRLISINTINQVINISKFRQKQYEDSFLESLMIQTGATAILSSGFYDIGRSKVYQVEFSIHFEGTEYNSASIILPFAYYPSHLFSTIYRPVERAEALKKLREMIKSYRRLN